VSLYEDTKAIKNERRDDMKSRTFVKSIVICLISLVLLSSVHSASGTTIDFNDGRIHDINYIVANSVTLDYMCPAIQTILNILPGANISGVYVYGNAIASMSGGTISSGSYSGFDNGRLSLTGGVAQYIGVSNSSRAAMLGGQTVELQGWNNGQLSLSGGTITDFFAFRNYSTLIICGSGFQINGIPVEYGQYNGTGHITGNLANGGTIDNNFYLYNSAKIKLVPILLHNPNGDERLCYLQSPYAIKWSNGVQISNMSVEYSVNNGVDWTSVQPPNSGNTGSYNWNIPHLSSNQCLVRITDSANSSVADMSDSVFEIYEPNLTVIQPNGRERIKKGTDYEIRWSSNLYKRDVLIEYSTDGNSWSTITTTRDTGSYIWHVNIPESAEYLIRMSDSNGWIVSDTSDDYFSIFSCIEEMPFDLNKDCSIDFEDFALMANEWLEKRFVRIYSFNLDSRPAWEMQGEWQFGQPTGGGGSQHGYPDPSSGKTGINVYGVNLAGDYNVVTGPTYYLIAGPFNCSGFFNVKLMFARWLNTDAPPNASCWVHVSTDKVHWNYVWGNVAAVTDNSWQDLEYDISSTADNQQTVYVRWAYRIISSALPYSGWNIDDIEIQGKK
jgi:hypothetical protein